MNKYIISILFLIVCCVNCYGQTPAQNAAKYDLYRDRLLQDYIIGVGSGAGMSLPASIRDTSTGSIFWGDATIDLSYYIGVLATEYFIKTQNSSVTDSTVRELFYAINTINRLDYSAEICFGGQSSLNGFFIRDDVTPDSLNMPQVISSLNQNTTTPVITQIVSDFSATDSTLKEMSLDQAIHLLAGLSLVVKYIPDSVTYIENGTIQSFYDFETSLNKEAKNIIIRIVNYMKEGNPVQVNLLPGDTNLLGIQGLNWDFVIKNPVSGSQVARGPNATGISIAFAGAKYRLTGQPSPTIMTNEYQQAIAIIQWLQDNILGNNQDDKVLLLNAMCNCWPLGDYTDTTTFNYNAFRIGPRAYDQSFEYITLIQQVLFNQPNYLLNHVPTSHPFYNNTHGYFTALLDSAPVAGPYNYGNGDYPAWQWSSTSRNIHPLRRGDLTPDFPGNYNGLDYMLLYNLHQVSNSITIDVEENDKNKLTSRIFPNPCVYELNIHLPASSTYSLKITSIEGKQIYYQDKIDDSFKFNCQSLQNGIYFIHISDSQNNFVQKVVVNH